MISRAILLLQYNDIDMHVYQIVCVRDFYQQNKRLLVQFYQELYETKFG